MLLMALPKNTIDVIAGVPQALDAIGQRAGIPGLARLGALLITAGGLGGVGAWVFDGLIRFYLTRVIF